MYKLQKYSTKFKKNNNLLYITKFLEHKHHILKGGALDEAKLQLIEELQEDINKKCTRVYELKHKPLESLDKTTLNNTLIIELYNTLIFKNNKNETITKICDKIYELMIDEIKIMFTENEFDGIDSSKINYSKKNELMYEKYIVLSMSHMKDIKIRNEIIFDYILPDNPKIIEHTNDYITKLINSKIEFISKQKVKNWETYDKILVVVLEHLLANIKVISMKFSKYLFDNILVNYDERISAYYDMIHHFSEISSQKNVIERGAIAAKEGAQIEDNIYSLFNKDSKYDNILFTSVTGNFDKTKKDIKGEFDLVIGDFDDSTLEYNIKKIYDIKRSANLIPDDVDKFTNAVNILNHDNIELTKRGSIYKKSGESIDYKGYIYVNDFSYNDLRFLINMNISYYIRILKDSDDINKLLLIFGLFKMENINGSDRPVIYLQDMMTKIKDLYDYIKMKYDETNADLAKVFKDFTVYRCNPE